MLRLRADQLDDMRLLGLKQVVSDHAGPCRMELQLTVDGRYQSNVIFGDRFGVSADEGLLTALERLFGAGCATML